VLNKSDIVDQKRLKSLKTFFEKTGVRTVEISALQEYHIEELKKAITTIVYGEDI
jgi:50S ribosomal subunit-associated GTPase HflX